MRYYDLPFGSYIGNRPFACCAAPRTVHRARAVSYSIARAAPTGMQRTGSTAEDAHGGTAE
jgi:hypothetical protein